LSHRIAEGNRPGRPIHQFWDIFIIFQPFLSFFGLNRNGWKSEDVSELRKGPTRTRVH
jgi:hypothetical protein